MCQGVCYTEHPLHVRMYVYPMLKLIKNCIIDCIFDCDLMQIYKSTKCNDIQQTGYCPRGPFCAFAHGDSKHTQH